MPRRGFEKISKAEILDALHQFARGRDECFTMKEFCTHIGIGCSTLLDRWGRWCDLRKAAGLSRPRCAPRLEFTDQELINEYRRISEKLGRSPREAEFNRLARCRFITLRKRFGTLEEIRRRARMTDQAIELWGRPSPLPDKPPLPWDVAWLSREWSNLRVGFAMYASDIRNDLIQNGLGAVVNWSIPPTPSTTPPGTPSVRVPVAPSVRDASAHPLRQTNPLTPPPFPFDLLVVAEHDWPGCPVPILRLRDLTRFRGTQEEPSAP